MKKVFSKLTTYLMIFVMLFTNPTTAIFANALEAEDGDTPQTRDTVTVGSLENEGDIQVTKKVTETDTPGVYKITFEIEGKPVTQTHPLYAAVVFDRSGSMICNPDYGYSEEVRNNAHFTSGDGQGIVCYNENGTTSGWFASSDDYLDSSIVTADKWNNAVAGAKTFESTISNALGENAHISLVTFATDASNATDSFEDASFGHPYGGTDLAGAIKKARQKLNNDTRNVENAKKVILVISDGKPNDTTAAESEATIAKNSTNNIEIYAIGYATDATTSAYLRDRISSYDSNNSNDNHYSDANPSTVAAAVQEMVNDLLAAGTNASIEDTLTTEFSFTSDAFTGKTHSFTLNNITNQKQTVTFFVKIDENQPTGYYDTNNTTDSKAKLTYTDAQGNQQTLVLNESPNVYWKRPSFNYTVNYYFAGVKDDELTVNESGELSTLIPYNDSIVRDGYKYDHIENYNNQEVQSVEITNDSNKNIVNVYYEKRTDLQYKVYYHYQKLNSESFDEVPDPNTYTATYEEIISGEKLENHKNAGLEGKEGFRFSYHTQSPDKIGTGNNRLDIFYTRNIYDYCINYFYDGVEDETVRVESSAQYGDMIEYQDKLREGYELSYTNPTSGSITIGTVVSENVIKVFYVKAQIEYTINYYKDDGTSTTKIGETVTNKALFDSDVTLTDAQLNERIPDGYKLQDGQVKTLHITADKTKNNIDVVYVKDNIEYTINYYKIDGDTTTKLGETVTKSAEFDSDVTLTDAELNERIPDGYTLKDGQGRTIHITANKENNNLDIYYVKGNINYTINYFKDDGTSTTKLGETVTKSAEFDSDVTLTEAELNDRIPDGYKLQDNQQTTLHITSDQTKNNIDVIYVKDNIDYTINYYKSDGTSTTKLGDTVTKSAEFDSDVTLTDAELNERIPDGYKLQDNQQTTLHITANKDNNNIDVVYVKDEFSYKVYYHYQGLNGEEDEVVEDTGSYKALFDEVISEDKVNEFIEKGLVGREDGFAVYKAEQSPKKIADNDSNRLDIYYSRREYGYCINYYYDGKEDESARVEDNALFGEMISYENKDKDGYVFSHTLPDSGEIEISSGKNELNVFYVKGEFEYTIEYFYDGVRDDSKTETLKALYEDVITNYPEKLIDGYEFEKDENTPLTISYKEEENVIRVYYKSLPEYEEIPNTGIDCNNSKELLMILISILLSMLYIEEKRNISEN